MKAAGEGERIAEQLRRMHEGDAWHGPSLKELLEGVTAQQAAKTPSPGMHSIWQLALHIAAWEEIVLRRLRGEVFTAKLDSTEDWPSVPKADDAAWQQAKDRLRKTGQELAGAIPASSEATLLETAAGQKYSNYVMLHGCVQHAAYHAGQMALVKKLLR